MLLLCEDVQKLYIYCDLLEGTGEDGILAEVYAVFVELDAVLSGSYDEAGPIGVDEVFGFFLFFLATRHCYFKSNLISFR